MSSQSPKTPGLPSVPNTPRPPEVPVPPGPDIVTAFRVQRNWMPSRLPSGRVEYAETLPSWRSVDLPRDQYQSELEEHQRKKREQEEQQGHEQEQASPAWPGAETPGVPIDTPQDERMGGMEDADSMREDDGGDTHASMDMDYATPSRPSTPFSGSFSDFDDDNPAAALEPLNDHPDIERPLLGASASGTTDDGQQPPPTGSAADMAENSEGELEEEQRGRPRAKKHSRAADSAEASRRKSSRKRTKTQRFVEQDG